MSAVEVQRIIKARPDSEQASALNGEFTVTIRSIGRRSTRRFTVKWPLVTLQFRELAGLLRWIGINMVWCDTELRDALYSMAAELQEKGVQ